MKTLTVFFLVLICTAGLCHADIELEVNKFQYTGMASEFNTSSESPQLKLKYNLGELYVFAAWETMNTYLIGARTFETDLIGVGVGKNIGITDNALFYFDLGYYLPNMRKFHGEGHNDEGMYYYMNKLLTGSAEEGRLWENYKVDKVSGAPGVVLGLKYTKAFSCFSVGINVGVRWLVTEYNLYGWDGEGGPEDQEGWWTFRQNMDYSGYFGGFVINF